MPYTRLVNDIIDVANDVEIHVSHIITDDGHKFVEIREYVPSLAEYGRGLTVTPEVAEKIKVQL